MLSTSYPPNLEPGESTALEVRLGDHAGGESPFSQTNARLGLGQTDDGELGVQHPEMPLALVAREDELVGDLLVGRWAGESAPSLVRAAQCHQDTALGGGQAHRVRPLRWGGLRGGGLRWGGLRGGGLRWGGLRRVVSSGRAESDRRGPETKDVTVAQAS